MPIQLVVDEYNIDTDNVQDTVSSPSDIYPYRERLYGYLKQNNQIVHRVCIKSQALYQRFKDFEGLDGVLPTIKLNPRSLFTKKIACNCPDWLTNNLIVELKLLDTSLIHESENIIDFIIDCVEPTIYNEPDLNKAIEKLGSKSLQFYKLFKVYDVRKRLISHFSGSFDVEPSRLESLFDYLFGEKDFNTSFNKLKIEIHIAELRKILSYFQINHPLPARTVSSDLLKFSNFELSEDSANELVSMWLELAEEINRQILHGKYDFTDIEKLIISPWPSLLNIIESFIEVNINYLTDELLFKLESFSTKDSDELLAKLNKYRESAEKIEFPINPDVATVLKWADSYLEKTRKDFRADNLIDSENALKFADWLNNQGPRISRTNYHWLSFSKQVSKSLDDNKIVVICMVDALSALHEDLIIDTFSTIEHLTLEKERLFAPLPTLTEVGKLTVLSGKEMGTHSLTSSAAIFDRYKENLSSSESLKIFKSWEDTKRSRIEVDNQLLVFFENRIDERLHDCPSFDKHRKDVKAVLTQLKTKIEAWRKDAIMLNKEIVFYITADHGMTVCDEHEAICLEGTVKDRVIKVDTRPRDLPKNCSFINIAGKGSGYIVPLDRRYFSSKKKGKVLTHGGMTPEEVFIPNYKLFSGKRSQYQDAIDVEVYEQECRKVNDKWTITLAFNSTVDIRDLKVNFQPPFSCYKKIETLESGKQIINEFEFKTEIEQAGLTIVSLHFSYLLRGNTYIEEKQVSLNFPRKLIEESAASNDFEGMFD